MRVNFLFILFCVFSILAQLVSLSTPEYVFPTIPLAIVATSIASMTLFLLADMLNEWHGLRTTLLAVFVGVALQVFVVISATMFDHKVSLSLASFSLLGLLLGDSLDAAIYAWMKRQNGPRLLALRTFLSTTAAIVIESILLVFAAPFFLLVLPQFLGKFIYSLFNVPIILLLHKWHLLHGEVKK